jgi:hypothetical protein
MQHLVELRGATANATTILRGCVGVNAGLSAEYRTETSEVVVTTTTKALASEVTLQASRILAAFREAGYAAERIRVR